MILYAIVSSEPLGYCEAHGVYTKKELAEHYLMLLEEKLGAYGTVYKICVVEIDKVPSDLVAFAGMTRGLGA